MSSSSALAFLWKNPLHKRINRVALLWMQLLIFLAKINDISGIEVWNMPRPIRAFQNYFDVDPVKYTIPDGIDLMNFTFQTSKEYESCPSKELLFVIQRGGLPLIKQTNQSFPDNYLLELTSDLRFSLVSGVLFSFSISHPLPGAWFVVAYHLDVDKEIRQKGLNSDPCVYSYMSQLDLGKVTHAYDVNIDEPESVMFESKQQFEFSFKLPGSSYGFQVTVIKCEPERCNLTLTSVSKSEGKSPTTVNCGNETLDCVLNIVSPSLQSKQRVTITSYTQSNVTFVVTVNDCPMLKVDPNDTISNSNGSLCSSLEPLDRVQPMEPFTAMYGYINQSVLSFDVKANQALYTVVPFQVLDPNDIGATLKWQMHLVNFSEPFVQLCGALLYDHLPNMSAPKVCHSLKGSLTRNYSQIEEDSMVLYVPYPRAGPWHILVQAICFDNDTQEEGSQCFTDVDLELSLEVQTCQDRGCSDRGNCLMNKLRGSDLILFTGCSCDADYQGYACTDDTNALSTSMQLASAYLLTLSNLFFLPAICVATYRRFLPEAFVYFYTMFFSTFYHACDGNRLMKYSECILHYDVLQMADFYGSACSLWLTVVAMASITYGQITPLLRIAGPFGIFIGVVYDKHSLGLIAVPMLCGLVLIICSWGYKMYVRRRLYPSRNRYLFFLLPGLLLAAVGASVFAFVETTTNYKYVHSFWHVAMALCICLLLPPKRAGTGGGADCDFNLTSHLLSPLSSIRSSRSSSQLEPIANGGYVQNASESNPAP